MLAIMLYTRASSTPIPVLKRTFVDVLDSDLIEYSLSLLQTAPSPYTDKKQNVKWPPDQVYL